MPKLNNYLFYKDDTVRLFLGDCLDIMKYIPNNYIDLILCDVPYGATARNEWDKVIPIDKLWEQYRRVIKNNGCIILTATQPFASELIMAAKDIFRYDLVWEKPLATGFLNANKMPLRSHESILVFYKKLPVYNPQKVPGTPYKITRRSDTLNYNECADLHHETNNTTGERYPKSVIRFAADKEKLHPTQKPVSLFKWLINTYTNIGDIILDSCIGSGTTAVAAKQLNRRCVGIEIREEYCRITKDRLQNTK